VVDGVTFDGVTKIKPVTMPRGFEERTSRNQARAKEAVRESQSAVVRSRELVKTSKKVVADIRNRRKRS